MRHRVRRPRRQVAMSECAQSHGPCPYELLIAFVTFASRADAVPQESL
jgi:hypothetical protein